MKASTVSIGVIMVSYCEALKLSNEPMAFFQCAQQSKITRLAGLTPPQRCKK